MIVVVQIKPAEGMKLLSLPELSDEAIDKVCQKFPFYAVVVMHRGPQDFGGQARRRSEVARLLRWSL